MNQSEKEKLQKEAMKVIEGIKTAVEFLPLAKAGFEAAMPLIITGRETFQNALSELQPVIKEWHEFGTNLQIQAFESWKKAGLSNDQAMEMILARNNIGIGRKILAVSSEIKKMSNEGIPKKTA